jgi:hypothetical protein
MEMISGRFARIDAQLIAALAAGFSALIVAILLSLPLESPHDALMNSATIALAGLVAVLGLAFAWRWLDPGSGESRALIRFGAINVTGFAAAAIVAFALQSAADLERSVSFIVPLAAVLFAGAFILTPLFGRSPAIARWSVIILAIAVVGLGAGLAGQGDQESGRLSLPAKSG